MVVIVVSPSNPFCEKKIMYKDLLKKYDKRELVMIRSSVKQARDKTQQIIDRFEKFKPAKFKAFKRKSGIVDLQKQLSFLNRSLNKIEEVISSK
jgi:hypothetical protein